MLAVLENEENKPKMTEILSIIEKIKADDSFQKFATDIETLNSDPKFLSTVMTTIINTFANLEKGELTTAVTCLGEFEPFVATMTYPEAANATCPLWAGVLPELDKEGCKPGDVIGNIKFTAPYFTCTPPTPSFT